MGKQWRPRPQCRPGEGDRGGDPNPWCPRMGTEAEGQCSQAGHQEDGTSGKQDLAPPPPPRLRPRPTDPAPRPGTPGPVFGLGWTPGSSLSRWPGSTRARRPPEGAGAAPRVGK